MANNTLPTNRINSGPCDKSPWPDYPENPGYEIHIPYIPIEEESCPCEETPCEVNPCSNSDSEMHVETKTESAYSYTLPWIDRETKGWQRTDFAYEEHTRNMMELNRAVKNGVQTSTKLGLGNNNMNFHSANGAWIFSAKDPADAADKLKTFNFAHTFADVPGFADQSYSEMLDTWNKTFATKTITVSQWTKVFNEDIDLICMPIGSNGSLTLHANLNKTSKLDLTQESKIEADLKSQGRPGGGSPGRGGSRPVTGADKTWDLWRHKITNTVTRGDTTTRWLPCFGLRYEHVIPHYDSDSTFIIDGSSAFGGGDEGFKQQYYITIEYFYSF